MGSIIWFSLRFPGFSVRISNGDFKIENKLQSSPNAPLIIRLLFIIAVYPSQELIIVGITSFDRKTIYT